MVLVLAVAAGRPAIGPCEAYALHRCVASRRAQRVQAQPRPTVSTHRSRSQARVDLAQESCGATAVVSETYGSRLTTTTYYHCFRAIALRQTRHKLHRPGEGRGEGYNAVVTLKPQREWHRKYIVASVQGGKDRATVLGTSSRKRKETARRAWADTKAARCYYNGGRGAFTISRENRGKGRVNA